MTAFIVGIAAFAAATLGGLFSLHFKDRLHLILGFSAGAILGVAFFDLLPESIEIASKTHSIEFITSIIALGFVIYMVLDRLVVLHSHGDETQHNARGIFGAGSLSLHSFLDGLGVGLAFQVSPTVGFVLAAAVLLHSFSDGINTVNLILKNGGSRISAFKWLFVDAVSPLLGIGTAFLFSVEESTLGLLLALFTGSFFYIGASDLLPESHHAHPVAWTTISAILGMGLLYVVVHLTHV